MHPPPQVPKGAMPPQTPIKANERIYHRKITARAILLHNTVAIPASGRHFVQVLQTNAPRNESKQVASK
jgi:hypothetical protein